MRYTDIAIVGGGLAGSTAAAMLGRAGIPAILIDPHPASRPDFRVEKLSAACRAGQWIECRVASYARHRTPDCQRVPFDFARVRHGPGRPYDLRLSGAHLLFRALKRPDSLSDPVSGRHDDAG